MGFIESLRQQKEVEARATQQKAHELAMAKQAEEAARQQREAQEEKFHNQRKQQAERFREESGVGAMVYELAKFMAPPTPPSFGPLDGRTVGYRSGSAGAEIYHNGFLQDRRPADPDSVFDTISWDKKSHYKKDYESEKFISVETCPDGKIIFHAGWFGSTTIPLEKWRSNNRESIFDSALEKAYNHPGTNRYTSYHPSDDKYRGGV